MLFTGVVLIKVPFLGSNSFFSLNPHLILWALVWSVSVSNAPHLYAPQHTSVFFFFSVRGTNTTNIPNKAIYPDYQCLIEENQENNYGFYCLQKTNLRLNKSKEWKLQLHVKALFFWSIFMSRHQNSFMQKTVFSTEMICSSSLVFNSFHLRKYSKLSLYRPS